MEGDRLGSGHIRSSVARDPDRVKRKSGARCDVLVQLHGDIRMADDGR